MLTVDKQTELKSLYLESLDIDWVVEDAQQRGTTCNSVAPKERVYIYDKINFYDKSRVCYNCGEIGYP